MELPTSPGDNDQATSRSSCPQWDATLWFMHLCNEWFRLDDITHKNPWNSKNTYIYLYTDTFTHECAYFLYDSWFYSKSMALLQTHEVSRPGVADSQSLWIWTPGSRATRGKVCGDDLGEQGTESAWTTCIVFLHQIPMVLWFIILESPEWTCLAKILKAYIPPIMKVENGAPGRWL